MNDVDKRIEEKAQVLLAGRLTAARLLDAGLKPEKVRKMRGARRRVVLREELAAVALRPFLYQIHLARCLPFMAQLPSASIDLIITSPPYNVRKVYGEGVNDEIAWPDYYTWLEQVIQECYRLLRTGGTLAMVVPNAIRWQRAHAYHDTWEDYDPTYVTHYQGQQVTGKGRIERLGAKISGMMFACDKHLREPITWVKAGPSGVPIATRHQMGCDSDPFFRATSEMILLGSKGQWHHRGGTGRRGRNALPYADWLKDVWLIPSVVNSTDHPAPFPTEIPRRLITIFTHTPDAVVFDPFTGSGQTQRAAIEVGLPWLGCEAVVKWARQTTADLSGLQAQKRLDLPVMKPTPRRHYQLTVEQI